MEGGVTLTPWRCCSVSPKGAKRSSRSSTLPRPSTPAAQLASFVERLLFPVL